MFGSDFLSTLFGLGFGLITGMTIGMPYIKYIQVVDTFSAFLAVYNHEKKYVTKNKKKDEPLTFWDKFSIVRNYLVVSFVRGMVLNGVMLFLGDKLHTFDLIESAEFSLHALKEPILSLIVIVAFEDFIETFLGTKIVNTCATITRVATSIAAFKTYGAQGTIVSYYELFRRNLFNGIITLITLTFINIVFRGDFIVLATWIGSRSFYVLLPILQVNYVNFGLDKLHGKLLTEIHGMTKSAGFDLSHHMTDGLLFLTLVVHLFANQYGAPLTRFAASYFK